MEVINIEDVTVPPSETEDLNYIELVGIRQELQQLRTENTTNAMWVVGSLMLIAGILTIIAFFNARGHMDK